MDEVLKGVCSSRGGDREIRRKMCDDAKELLFFCKVMGIQICIDCISKHFS